MYHTFYLRFDDEAAANGVLVEGEKFKYAAVDVIGTIYKGSGNVIQTEEGPIEEMVPVDGWHVNVRHPEECPELDPYRVTPITPVRDWA